jgi:hypothetical protein
MGLDSSLIERRPARVAHEKLAATSWCPAEPVFEHTLFENILSAMTTSKASGGYLAINVGKQ